MAWAFLTGLAAALSLNTNTDYDHMFLVDPLLCSAGLGIALAIAWWVVDTRE